MNIDLFYFILLTAFFLYAGVTDYRKENYRYACLLFFCAGVEWMMVMTTLSGHYK